MLSWLATRSLRSSPAGVRVFCEWYESQMPEAFSVALFGFDDDDNDAADDDGSRSISDDVAEGTFWRTAGEEARPEGAFLVSRAAGGREGGHGPVGRETYGRPAREPSGRETPGGSGPGRGVSGAAFCAMCCACCWTRCPRGRETAGMRIGTT